MIGVEQPPEDAHGRPGEDAAEGLAERRARRDLPAELDRLRVRVGELEVLLAQERAQRLSLQEQLQQTERTIADVRTGAMELALRLTAEQDARRAGTPPSEGEPAQAHPHEAAAAPRAAPTDPAPEPVVEVAPTAARPVDPETRTLIEGLQRAAERLRTQVGEREDDAREPDAEVDVEQEPEAPSPEPEAPAPEAPAPAPPEPQPVVVLGARREQPPGPAPWLTGALDRLVAADHERAAGAITALIPAQAARSRRDLVYDLALVGSGTWRVRLQSGAGTVGPLLGGPASNREIDFVLSGPPGSLVPLAAGGARRRLSGTLVTGRRRRLRRLLRDLRAPMTLGDVLASGTTVDASVLLELLALTVEPAWTGDHAFVVDYDVTGPSAGRWRVAVGDGVRTGPAPSTRDAEATVTVSAAALVALLAGVPLPAGETATVAGSADAVALLHGWFDTVQGVSA